MDPSAFLSDRARGVRQSAVRDVFDLAMSPGLVSLAGGMPAVTALPLILRGLRGKGLRPVTVPQLLVDNPRRAVSLGRG